MIVGSGAGGGSLAFKLSQAGCDVLVLEKGPRYDRTTYLHDETATQMGHQRFVPALEDEPHVLVEEDVPDAKPQATLRGWIACCVGGGTSHMDGSLFRFHPDDFRLASRFGHYEEVVDWPYSYDELEPYYCEAEALIGVSGAADANPFEGARTRAYPMPPLSEHRLSHVFDEASRRLGLHPFPTPRAVNSIPYAGRPACSYCDFCAGYGCPTGARGSTQESVLAMAESTGNCEVRPNAMVCRIVTGPRGRVTGCVYLDAEGTEHLVEASVVCVCCSAIESARLLLLSASREYPEGLANRSGLVGRHLQLHAGSTGRARFRHGPGINGSLNGTFPLQRSVMDYYFLPPDVSSFPKGGIHRFDFETTWPIRVAQQLAFKNTEGALWGERLKARLREHFLEGRDVEFEVFQDFIPNRRTYVELDPEVRDKWGLPVARIHVAELEHHRTAGRWLVDRGLEILDAMGADHVSSGGCGYTNWFMTHGTCRAGVDPRTSVTNEFCRAHELSNLFIVDGSFMPTSGGAPSTLTNIANSLRTGDHIASLARTGSLRC